MAKRKDKFCDLQQKIQSYFDYCDELNGESDEIVKPYTFSGLLSHLSLTRDEFSRLLQMRKYSSVLHSAMAKIEAYIEENSLTGGLSINASANSLKYNFGWGERQTEHKTESICEDISINLCPEIKEYGK